MVHIQFLNIKVMKNNADMGKHRLDIESLVNFLYGIMTKQGDFYILDCSQHGRSSKSEFHSFIQCGMEEVLLLMVYNTLPSKKKIQMVNVIDHFIDAKRQYRPRLNMNYSTHCKIMGLWAASVTVLQVGKRL